MILDIRMTYKSRDSTHTISSHFGKPMADLTTSKKQFASLMPSEFMDDLRMI